MNRNRITKKTKTGTRKRAPSKQTFAKRLLGLAWLNRNWFERFFVGLLAAFMLLVTVSYSIGYWYQQRHKDEPLIIGTTFIPRYARFFDLDPKETLHDTLYDLGIKRLRLVSYWKEIEREPGQYDFTDLDWQFAMAEEAGAEVSLSIGLRQPRWPECHEPKWAQNMPKEQWYPKLKQYMAAVIDRYKDSSALKSYQLENEYFMTVFGECSDFERERLVDEFNFVKQQDPSRPITITRSNNWGGWPIGEPTPDVFGVAVYKRVFDYTVTNRYFEYPYPSWFYASLAGAGELASGKPLIIHELQMEPWMPENYHINHLSDIPEQNKSMNAERLKDRFRYAEDTGLRTIDTWGVEWWYWRKVKANDPTVWDTARSEIQRINHQNQ